MEGQLNRGDIVHYEDDDGDFCYALVTEQSPKDTQHFAGVVLHGDGGTHQNGKYLNHWNKKLFEYLSEDLTFTITAPDEYKDKSQEDHMQQLLDVLDDKLNPGAKKKPLKKPVQNEKKSTLSPELPDFSDFDHGFDETAEEAAPSRGMSHREFDL